MIYLLLKDAKDHQKTLRFEKDSQQSNSMHNQYRNIGNFSIHIMNMLKKKSGKQPFHNKPQKYLGILSFADIWMQPETIILSDVSQAQKVKSHMFSLIHGL
jgi:hypothetical protein